MTTYLPLVTLLMIIITPIIGWIVNLCELISNLGDASTMMSIFRLVGVIIAPLGAILGYF
jgi:hypothetical protein